MEWALMSFMIGMMGISYSMYRVANGRLSKKVSEDTCSANVDNMSKRFDDIKGYMNERFDDLKDTIKNGK